jgi:hypothetical protein
VFKWAAAGTLGVLVVLLAGYGVYTIRSILVLVLIALFVAVSLEPVHRYAAGDPPLWTIRLKIRATISDLRAGGRRVPQLSETCALGALPGRKSLTVARGPRPGRDDEVVVSVGAWT